MKTLATLLIAFCLSPCYVYSQVTKAQVRAMLAEVGSTEKNVGAVLVDGENPFSRLEVTFTEMKLSDYCVQLEGVSKSSGYYDVKTILAIPMTEIRVLAVKKIV